MRCTRKKLVHILFIFSLLFSSSILFSNLASAQLTSSWTASSSGTIAYNQSIHQLKISIDFTSSYLTSASYGYDLHGDGCDYLVGTTTPINPAIGGPMSNTLASINSTFGHNSAPSLYLADTSGASARAEFNINHMETKIGNEMYASVWYYLPSDWVVGSSSGWASFANPLFGGYDADWKPYIELGVLQGSGGANPPYSTNSSNFVVALWGCDVNTQQFRLLNSNGTWAQYEFQQSQFPRGRWFNVQWWLRRDPTPGHSFLNLWFDGVKICNQTAFPYESGPLNRWTRDTSGLNNIWTYAGDPAYTDLVDFGYSASYFCTFAKVYHGGYGYIHEIWADDLEIWDGKP